MDIKGKFSWTKWVNSCRHSRIILVHMFFHENSSFGMNFHGHFLDEFSRTFVVNFHGHFFNSKDESDTNIKQ